MKLSVTLLSTYLYCQRKLFLQEVLKLKEPPKPVLMFGTIRHQTLEAAHEQEQKFVEFVTAQHNKEHIIDHFRESYDNLLREVIAKHKKSLYGLNIDPLDAYHNAASSINGQALARALHVHEFSTKNNVFGTDLWHQLLPKIQCETRIESEDLHLKGIVDQIHHDADHSYPVELKTGKAPNDGVWPGHRIQLAAYALLLEEQLKIPVNQGYVHYLDTNQKRMIEINPFMKLEIKNLVQEIQLLLDNQLLPETCANKNKCVRCGVREQCGNEEFLSRQLRESQLKLSL